jgi:hypothetical protein
MAVRDPVMTKEESREVRCAIRRVFLDVWDPIRISDEPNAQDEYDGYIGRVFELLTTGGRDEEIIEYLLWATDRMGWMGVGRVCKRWWLHYVPFGGQIPFEADVIWRLGSAGIPIVRGRAC